MAIEIEVVGTGRFAGHKSSIASYSYSEQSTPHIIGDDSGGVGDISFDAPDSNNDGAVLYKDEIILTDDEYGSITGRIDSLSSSNGVLSLTGRSRLGLINTPAVVPPGFTTIKDLMTGILAAAGVTTDVAFSPAIPFDPIVSPGYEGDLWVFLKQACAAYQVEVSLINNTIYFQPIRQREIDVFNVVDESYTISDVDLAQSFDVAYYNYTDETEALIFPRGGWVPEVAVYQVEHGETVVFDIAVEGYVTSVKQPVAEDVVPKDYSGPNSVYSVSGNDNLPVSADFWNDFGGKVSFEIVENGTLVRVTIVGPQFENLSPYSIAISDGSTSYSTLRIIGDGVFSDRKILNITTGLTKDLAPTEVGAEIDNIHVDTLVQARDLGIKARQQYALPRHTFDVSGRSFVKRNFTEYEYFKLDDADVGTLNGESVLAFVPDEKAIAIYMSFEEYNEKMNAGYVFSDFNDDYANAAFEDFSETVISLFAQSFGSVTGSRVKYFDGYYRVRSSEISQSGISVTAEFDTLLSDFNNTFAGLTFEDFYEIPVGLSFTDWALIPLRTEPYLTFDYLVLDEGILDVNALGF